MTKIPNDVIAAAKVSQAKWKIPASVCIAQWALESAWGKRMSGKNNPFGIKALAGHSATSRMTWEVVNGKRVNMTQQFADFASLDEAFDAHGKLLATGKPYAKARAVLPDADKFANALTGVYATDPDYGLKLRQTMKANNLYQHDKVTT